MDKAHHNFIPAVINVQNATTMDVDVRMENVYWVDAKAKSVMRANLNGSLMETVIDSPGNAITGSKLAGRPTSCQIVFASGAGYQPNHKTLASLGETTNSTRALI